MNKFVLLTMLLAAGVTEMCLGADDPLVVSHKQPTGKPLKDPPYPYMWYYRTEVHNKSDGWLRIVWFEGFGKDEEGWYSNNVLGRTLRGMVFSAWYTEGDPTEAGLIQPGQVAVCDVNWHGSVDAKPPEAKWAFIAVDAAGNDYFVEEEVTPAALKLVISKKGKQSSGGDSDEADDRLSGRSQE
jgi:hypothetical protein